MPELLATVEATHRVEKRRQRFMAALQGVDLDKDNEKEEQEKTRPLTVDEIKAKAMARLTGNMATAQAIAEGFTSDMGVQYKIVEGADIG